MPLESSPEHPQPLRVIAQAVKGWVDRMGWVWVEGQLIEINRRSGARLIFLTVRDRLAEVSVSVTLSPATLDAAGPLTEGATVVLHLKASFYTGTGRFSFTCDEITPVGEGRLLARLEQTKRLLQAEGLFNPARRRRLPFLPRVVGLVTGAESAAERDVVENARQRWPGVRFDVRYALVQGPQAAEQVIGMVKRLDAEPEVDVIVIARGGGSLEDLLAFSDEGLVRAVYATTTPVVSAIGHETDTPILDLVADLRASTPTDAAKRIVPDVRDESERIDQARARLDQAIVARLASEQQTLTALRSRPVLADPTATFALRYEALDGLRRRAHAAVEHGLRHETSAVEAALARVRAMSPKATLERGYAIVVDRDGRGVTSVADVAPDDDVLAYLADGQLSLTVREVGAPARPIATRTGDSDAPG
ncbi:MAG: exodeoxyribonuclease VII large subunit [Propionibacteriaceae bacterium]